MGLEIKTETKEGVRPCVWKASFENDRKSFTDKDGEFYDNSFYREYCQNCDGYNIECTSYYPIPNKEQNKDD